MTDRTILRLRVVMHRCGLARSTLYDKMSKGEFPKPISLGPRAVGWIADEVEQWIQDRIEQSRPEGQAA